MISAELYDQEQFSITICGNILTPNHFPLLWHDELGLWVFAFETLTAFSFLTVEAQG